MLMLLAQTQAPGPVTAKPWVIELSTLELLHAKGVLNDAEYDSAVRDLRDSLGLRAPDGTTLAVSNLALTLYGFVQANAIYDTTESFAEQMGNGQVARPGTYGGGHDRFQMSARHSRFGFRLKAPELYNVRASAQFEMDFFGTQLPVGAGQPFFGSESAFVASPTFRARHLFFRLETPWVDLLAGQFWPIFGGQPAGNPNAIEIQGLPSQLYSRMPQVRLSKAWRTESAWFDAAVAAVRSPQRDSGLPDAQASFRVSLPKWQGFSTAGGTASAEVLPSLTLSGTLRSIRLPEFSATPTSSRAALGGGVALDLVVPLIRGTAQHHPNALTFIAEGVYGQGTSDLYGGLNGGIGFPALPNPNNVSPAPTYAQDIDNGIATYDSSGTLHLVQWSSFMVNMQYYLPVADGRVWVSAIYSRSWSDNSASLGTSAARTRQSLDAVFGSVFAEVLPQVRFGLEYSVLLDHYVDGVTATNHRVNFAAYYMF